MQVRKILADILVKILDRDEKNIGGISAYLTTVRRSSLFKRGLLEESTTYDDYDIKQIKNNARFAPIKLTNVGRFRAISCKMYLHPIDMFILSDMYVDYTVRKNNNMPEFPYSFEQLEPMLMAIISKQVIYNKFCRLKQAGAIIKKSPKHYIITDRWAKRLNRYNDDVFAMSDFIHNNGSIN